MRKSKGPIIGAICVGVVIICAVLFFMFYDGNISKIKQLCFDFERASKDNDRIAMSLLYPTLPPNAVVAFDIAESKLDIIKDSSGNGYTAFLGEGKKLVFSRNILGGFTIGDSEGIFTIPELFPDGHYCYEGTWTSHKYPTPYPIRIEFDKKGDVFYNGMYTNITFDIKMALSGGFDGDVLSFKGKNVIFELTPDGDSSHLTGLGMDIKLQGEADIDMELLK